MTSYCDERTLTIAANSGVLYSPAGTVVGTTLVPGNCRLWTIEVLCPSAEALRVRVYRARNVSTHAAIAAATIGASGVQMPEGAASVVLAALPTEIDTEAELVAVGAGNTQDGGGAAINASCFMALGGADGLACPEGCFVWVQNVGSGSTGAVLVAMTATLTRGNG